MIPIVNSKTIHNLDQNTLKLEEIKSWDLMERAATVLMEEIWKAVGLPNRVLIFAGPGNNGGDALALARLLIQTGSDKVLLFYLGDKQTGSEERVVNFKLAKKVKEISFLNLEDFDLAQLHEHASDANLIVDGLFGVGLNKPFSDQINEFISSINNLKCTKVAIDVPSGTSEMFFSGNVQFQADYTFCIEYPKLSYFLPETGNAWGKLKMVSIDLVFDESLEVGPKSRLITLEYLQSIFKHRKRFSHKGTYGHALIVAGLQGSEELFASGAAILAAGACSKAGAGKTTLISSNQTLNATIQNFPEVMGNGFGPKMELDIYQAIGIGPSLGTNLAAQDAFQNILYKRKNKPIIFDADALNLLANFQTLEKVFVEGDILTPHMKEFDKLFGASANWYERVDLAKKVSLKYPIVLVLKNSNTFIFQNGELFVNPTGNPALAKGGSGDVLLGMITAFLAQGYSSLNASILGVYLHGRCSDLAIEKSVSSMETFVASDILSFLPEAFNEIQLPKKF